MFREIVRRANDGGSNEIYRICRGSDTCFVYCFARAFMVPFAEMYQAAASGRFKVFTRDGFFRLVMVGTAYLFVGVMLA